MSFCTAFLAVLSAAVFFCGHSADAKYAVDMALSALQFSKASYCESDAIERWDCCSCGANPSFQNRTVVFRKDWGIQTFFGVSSSRIVVTFRGSQNIDNWVTNLHTAHKAYPNTDCTGCKVHSGFLNAYRSVSADVLTGVRSLLNEYPTRSVLITGHSLGGALATFAAADVAHLRNASGVTPHVELYTFGSPRVANQAFANWFAQLFSSGGHESYRVTHTRDMVPHLPPAFAGFVHVSQEVWYNNNKETDWTSCNDVNRTNGATVIVTEDSTCSNSVVALSTVDHLFYLGMATSCSCNKDAVDATETPEPGAQVEMIVMADYVYTRASISALLPKRLQIN